MTLTIAEAESLITDKRRGKYPHDSPHRRELVRALRFATKVWGATTAWADIDESHWRELLRTRLDALLAQDDDGLRATEITVAKVKTTVLWLRKEKHIAPRAAQWPLDWKAEITRYWKGVTGSVRNPVSKQLEHTEGEARAILKASTFDPRFELLMWLGMDQLLGQVARACRSDLDLPPLGGESYGILKVHGGGKGRSSVVHLDAGQRKVIERMIASGGYLHEFEQRYEQSRTDYLLFPAGYMAGRVGRTRGKDAAFVLSSVAKLTKHASGSWIRQNFQVAEERAGVEHVKGRGALGLRRVSESGPAVGRTRRQALRGEILTATDAGEPHRRDTDASLQSLVGRVSASAEQSFLNEAVMCYAVTAYRAAIIMTWNLALDHLYEYILQHKLAAFNIELGKITDKRVKVSVVYSKDDFSDIPEVKFVELCRASGVVSNDVRKILDTKLGTRNSYAHPSTLVLSPITASEFIQDLINNVVLKFKV